MGRPSLAEQRRVEICRALQSCVIRNGSYEMTSVKDIAQEAGMAAGMLHHYFESKDDILLVTAEMVLLELQNHLSDLLRIKDAAEREKMLEELLGDNEQNRFYIMLQAMALAMPTVKKLAQSIFENRAAAWQAGGDAGYPGRTAGIPRERPGKGQSRCGSDDLPAVQRADHPQGRTERRRAADDSGYPAGAFPIGLNYNRHALRGVLFCGVGKGFLAAGVAVWEDS